MVIAAVLMTAALTGIFSTSTMAAYAQRGGGFASGIEDRVQEILGSSGGVWVGIEDRVQGLLTGTIGEGFRGERLF